MTNTFLFLAYGIVSSASILILRLAGIGLQSKASLNTIDTRSVILLATAAVLYAISFSLWAWVLSRSSITVAYPVCFGLTLLISTILAATLLHEHVTLVRLCGMVLIIVGAVLVVRT